MSKIDTIESISNKLAASSIAVEPKRCVYIRNWHSRCKACLSACQHDAIDRSLGHLSIDSEKCTNCAACVCACPTSTYSTTAPSQTEIVRQARVSAQANAGSAAFICERQAAAAHVDANRVVVLPCLDYLDEYLIAGMLGLGFARVILFSLGCDGCDIDCEQPYFEHMASSTRQLLDLWQVPGTFATLEEVPSALISDKPHTKAQVMQSDRREAFQQAGASAANAALEAVAGAIGRLSGEAKASADDQIIMSPDERYPADTYRSVRLLRMLDKVGSHPKDATTIDSRFWASVDIDPNLCKHCGACARMCITQALKYHVNDEGKATLTFEPALCTNCRLCKDSCLSHSMVYSTKVLAGDLKAGVVKTLFEDEELPVKNMPIIER